MDRLGGILLAVAIIVVLCGLMALGWRHRRSRQGAAPELPAVPELGEAELGAAGQYICTTTAGDWLDRIVAHRLGFRGPVQAEIHPEGLLLLRGSAPTLFINTTSITEVRSEPGMAGKFVGQEGILVVSWLWGERAVDTGLRLRYAAEREPFLQALAAAIPEPPETPTPHRFVVSTKDQK
ncbi:hypothetical protein [Psychromicrobium xiongbiense]|uniref:PH-like domain-containing protein n=1 Tax=Psychromicrobium xiongbiense TaxID=3051184 RepID=UPI002557352E|nr:hypothetical protein [Psychromicrobium sp. YIM S02556]